MLLLAIFVIFVIARSMKDAKAFTKLMAILAVSALAGAGIKHSFVKTDNAIPEKTTVVSTNAVPTQNGTAPFIQGGTSTNPDSVSKDTTARDSVETKVGKLPAIVLENDIQDDS